MLSFWVRQNVKIAFVDWLASVDLNSQGFIVVRLTGVAEYLRVCSTIYSCVNHGYPNLPAQPS